jgi:ribosomal protein L13
MAIRGMLPDYREGRGRDAFKKINVITRFQKNLKIKKQ